MVQVHPDPPFLYFKMKNVVVIGANGAIGNAFVSSFVNNTDIKNIFTLGRAETKNYSKRIKHFIADITDESAIEDFASSIDVTLDAVIVATGILHADGINPEKSIRDIDLETFSEILKINTIGPAIIGKHLLPLLNNQTKSVMAFLSARVGSISDNKLGGWYAYRASKSALNQVIKNFSIEIGRRNKNAVVIGFQPGTVDSNLSKPFQKNVNKDKLFTPEFSVEKMTHVIENLTSEDSGNIFDWSGEIINP